MTETQNYLNDGHSIRSWLLTTDHKRIAMLYMLSITFFFLFGGAAAVLIRMELMTPEGALMRADTYNKLFSLHGIIMVFFFLVPSIPAVLGNFLIPLMIGARDMAFPKLNLLSWYIFMLGGLFSLTTILVGGVDTGWTFYTPYSSTYANTYVILAAVGIFIAGFSSILTGLNFIVTIHLLRAPGMHWFRLPLFVWTHYATSLIMVLGTPVLAVSLALVGVERLLGVGIFDPALGGDPLLFQHLFWFYSHPAVYIMILPGMGVVSELVACFSRKPIFGYGFVAMAGMCQRAIGLRRTGVLFSFHVGRDSFGSESLQLDSHHVQRHDLPEDAYAVRSWVHRAVHRRRVDRNLSRHVVVRCSRARHVFHCGPFSLHHGGQCSDGLSGRTPFLVAQNYRTYLFGVVGPSQRIGDLFRLQSCILPTVCAGLSWKPASLPSVSR